MNKDRFDIISSGIIKWCLYSIVFAAPFSKSISEFAIALAIILWFFKKVIKKDFHLERTDLNIPFLVFVVTVIPSFFNSAYFALSIKAFFTKILEFVLLYFVIVENIDTKSKLKDLLIIAFISTIVIALDGFVQYYYAGRDGLHYYPSYKARAVYDGAGFFRGYPTASFPFPNDLAAWILLVLFPLVSVTIFDLNRKAIRYFTTIVSSSLFFLFILTKARGAWIGLTISTLYIAFSKNKLWLLLLIALIVITPVILKMEMAHFMFSLGSLEDRFTMLNTGWKIFMAHPIIGNGLNTFFVNFKKYRNDEWKDKRGSYAHNCYLQMAADTGIVGLIGFLWLIFSYFLSIIKNLPNIRDEFYNSILWGISIGIFAFLVHSFFDTNLYSLNLATLFWFAIGLSQSMLKICKIDNS